MSEVATIEIGVKHAKLSIIKSATVVSGNNRSIQCIFEFRSTDWAETTRAAVFQGMTNYLKGNNEGRYIRPLDGNNCVVVPLELMGDQDEILIGVFGKYSDNTQIVSNFLAFKIDRGCYCIGSTPSTSTSTSVTTDGSSIVNDCDVLALYGFSAASAGQYPSKGADGKLQWVSGNSVVLYGYYLNNKFYTDSTYTVEMSKYADCLYIDKNNPSIAGNHEYTGAYVCDGNEFRHVSPKATDTIDGIMKLYQDYGTNTDGSISQKIITDSIQIQIDETNECLTLNLPLN